MEVKQEAAPGVAPGVKVEVKQEAPLPKVKVEVEQEVLPLEVKVEVPKVKVEVKDKPSSPSHGQPPSIRALKRARMEATPPAPPPSPPPPEPWRAVYAIPAMYRCLDDREWAGYNTDVRLSSAAAGIIVINDDKDADGGANADVKGKATL
jgi:hypothetical protein